MQHNHERVSCVLTPLGNNRGTPDLQWTRSNTRTLVTLDMQLYVPQLYTAYYIIIVVKYATPDGGGAAIGR